MCGHVGLAGDLTHKDEKTFQRLLMYDYFRGTDSTGVAGIKKTGNHKIAKVASHPLDLFEMNRWKEAVTPYASLALIGHNRAATKGVVNTVNAHPYEFGHIIGAHNGTLTQSSHKALEELAGETFSVDSMAIFAAIAKAGIEETVKVMQGAWSLVWYDCEKKRLCFLRNKERPMWYALTADFKKLIWASEYPMIRAANELQSTPDKLFTTPENYAFFSTDENVLYEYDLEALAKGGTRPDARVCELKGKDPAPATSTMGFTAGYRPTGTVSTSTTKSHSNTSRFPRPRDPETIVVSLYGNTKAPFADLYERHEFEMITKNGCDWCGEEMSFDDPGIVILQKSGTVLCPSCTSVSGDKSNRVYALDIKKIASAK